MALPLDKLGTTYGPTTDVVEPDRTRPSTLPVLVDTDVARSAGSVDGATADVSGASGQGAGVAEHGLAEVV